MNNNTIEVSVLVLTYNSALEKLISTVKSVIDQKGVSLEIVISDDGSKVKSFNELKDYFNQTHFVDYKIIENEINRGTVYNYYSGLKMCNGNYVKTISPGDKLFGENTLKNWITFLKTNNAKWSFSDMICYKKMNNIETPISVEAHPQNTYIYKNGTDHNKIWQYLVLNDIGVGASMISERNLQISYCQEILGKIIFAEDHIWRLMMFDGIIGAYYPEYTVLYEYGEGVSTSQNNIWIERLQKDWQGADSIIFEREPANRFQKNIQRAMKIVTGKSKIKKMFIKGFVHNKLRKKKRMTISTWLSEKVKCQ